MTENREFEKYLEGSSDLSKLYDELPKPKLPDHLDAAILAEAHRAVNSRPGGKPKHRWTLPLGMVASLLVVVMIGLQLPYMLQDAAPPQQQKEERMAAAMDSRMAERATVMPEKLEKLQDMAPLMAKRKPETLSVETRSVPAEAEAPARVNAPMPAAPALPMARKSLELRERTDGVNAVILSKEKKSAAYAEESAGDGRPLPSPAAASVAPAPLQMERAPLGVVKDEENILGPEESLKNIMRLKQAGKLEQAKKEWELFKKRYPNYQVPVEIEF